MPQKVLDSATGSSVVCPAWLPTEDSLMGSESNRPWEDPPSNRRLPTSTMHSPSLREAGCCFAKPVWTKPQANRPTAAALIRRGRCFDDDRVRVRFYVAARSLNWSGRCSVQLGVKTCLPTLRGRGSRGAVEAAAGPPIGSRSASCVVDCRLRSAAVSRDALPGSRRRVDGVFPAKRWDSR